jgi:hypothetical protein
MVDKRRKEYENRENGKGIFRICISRQVSKWLPTFSPAFVKSDPKCASYCETGFEEANRTPPPNLLETYLWAPA